MLAMPRGRREALILANAKKAVVTFVLVVVLPNMFFWLASVNFGVSRPWINADYVLVVMLMRAGWRRVAVGLLIPFVLVDVAEVVGQVFPFGDLVQIMYLLKFAHLAPPLYQAGVLLLLVWLVVLSVVLLRFAKMVDVRWVVLVLLPLAMVNAWAFSGISAGKGHNFFLGSQAGGGLSRFLRLSHGVDVRMFGPAKLQPFMGVSGAEAWFNAVVANQGLPDRMLLVVVESWGIFSNPSFQAEVIKPLSDMRPALLDWNEGRVRTGGNTVEGEIRELCHKVPSNINVANIDGMRDCLPAQLKRKGYRTYAFHAASGVMYDRASWYSRIGLDDVSFFETKQWPRRCFSFPGACDQDVGQALSSVFAVDSSKVFAYWLTLNSHSPYDERDAGDAEMPCARVGLRHDDAACRLARIQRHFFRNLAELVRSGRLQGVSVVVVGDHQPPMLVANDALPVVDGQVPFLRFSIP